MSTVTIQNPTNPPPNRGSVHLRQLNVSNALSIGGMLENTGDVVLHAGLSVGGHTVLNSLNT